MPLPRTPPPIPDLLSAVPAVRVDALALRQILVFAFATGGARESFDDVLGSATLPATRFDRDDFARDLFLDRLVAQSLAVRIDGRPQKVCAPYVLRVLTEPPEDIDVVHFRRGVLAELAASGRSPHKKLTAITKHLIEVWAHEGGRVYVVMSLLALHQRRFRALHVEIYSSFYEALMPVLRELKPRAGRAELLGRARLISTLIDGALVQVPDRNFLAQAVAAVLRIAEE